MDKSTQSEVVAALDSLHKLITKGWCQGYSAKDKDGIPVAANSPKACCWCLSGAMILMLLREEIGGTIHTYVLNAITKEIQPGFYYIPDYNDSPGRTKEEVLGKITSAREKLDTITA